MNNDAVEMVVKELDALGLKYNIAPAGKHQKIFWNSGGALRQYTLPITPSDHRAALNCRSEVRRMLKADGLLKEKTIDDLDNKEANRHLFRKIKRLEAEREEEKRQNAEALKKLRDDLEAMAALMQTPVKGPDPHIIPPPYSAPTKVVPWAAEATPNAVTKAAIAEAEAGRVDYDRLEAECAKNLRLPPREGYRILPERYARIYHSKHNPDALPELVSQASKRSVAPYLKVEEDKRLERRRNFSPEGLAKVRENIAKGRAVRLARLQAKKALADE